MGGAGQKRSKPQPVGWLRVFMLLLVSLRGANFSDLSDRWEVVGLLDRWVWT
jgi:hypothetical protein